MPVDDLPFVDEHAIDAAVTPDVLWDASVATLRESLSGTGPSIAARLLGCDPGPGSAMVGFREVVADRPRLFVIAGRHRFSRYAIVVRVDAVADGARCRMESRAAFPGIHGALYRLAVVGSGGHAVAVRHLLRQIRRRAESPDRRGEVRSSRGAGSR